MADTIDMIYMRIRAQEAAARQERVERAYAKEPRFAKLDESRAQLVAQIGQRQLSPAEGRERLMEIAREEQELLARMKLPADELELHYRCPLCRDTGYVGEAAKAPCACRLKLREQQSGGQGINSRETFAGFDEGVYPDELQKKRALNAKRLCEGYALSLPHPEKPNLLLMGMPGLGKSYLGNAIAYSAISRGIDVSRVTAYRFVQDVLAEFRQRTGETGRYQRVPLLILDDLGSEPDIPNVSTEWLFAVINERALNNLPTVCITNLSFTELQTRYGERVMSRLADKNTTVALQLTGKNLRTV